MTQTAQLEIPPTLSDSMAPAMRRLAKSVCIVTVRHQGQRMAMAATAIDSLSMDPPSLLVCINRTASIFPAFTAKNDFCINILANGQQFLAEHCNGPVKGEARFEKGDWVDDATPWLPYAQAAVFCRHDGEFFYGTHGVFVGRVSDVRIHGEVDPLVYADGVYGTTDLRRPA